MLGSMRRTKSKKRNNYIHCKRRIRERHGITIDRNIYNRLCNQVKTGRSIFLGRQTTSRTVHQVKIAGKKIIVVYNTNVGNICTVLNPGRTYRLQ